MKQFFSNFLSSFLALVIFSVCTCLLILGIIIAIVSLSQKEDIEIESKSVLVINTNQLFNERGTEDGWDKIWNDESSLGMRTVKKLIKDASQNPKISAVLIKCQGQANNLSVSNELYNYLNQFKSSGKKIYAYGTYNEKNYFIASMAHHIYAEPAGIFEWNGFGIQSLFFKKLLEKWDLKAQIFYAGKFKSATEPLRRESMSEENKLQLGTLLKAFQTGMYEKIASQRGMTKEELIRLENNLLIQNLSDAKKYHLIDDVKYSDEVEAKIKADIGIGNKEKLSLISLQEYQEQMDDVLSSSNKKNIAVIYADGTIVHGTSDNEGEINTTDIVQSLREAQADEDIKGIVLRVNSPGGDVQASEKIWRAVSEAKKHKPLVISFGSVAASGGYYIATGADEIFAEPFTITGSIGVFAIIPNIGDFTSKHLGITTDEVGTSPHANFGIHKELTPLQAKFVQNHIDSVYIDFKTHVSNARKLNLQQVEAIAQGRVWIAQQAVENKLVDKIGSLDDAIQFVQQKAQLTQIGVEEYPKQKSSVERIMNKLNKKTNSWFNTTVIDEDVAMLTKQLKVVKKMVNHSHAQMKLPYFFEAY